MSESFVVELRVSRFGEKTSRHFMKNKPLFCEKQAVVLWKTSRRFVENKPSFCGKSKMDEKASGRGEKEGWGDGIFMGEDGE